MGGTDETIELWCPPRHNWGLNSMLSYLSLSETLRFNFFDLTLKICHIPGRQNLPENISFSLH